MATKQPVTYDDVSKSAASMMYFVLERHGPKEPTHPQRRYANRLCKQFEGMLCEYPPDHGRELTVVDTNGKPTGEKRKAWKFVYEGDEKTILEVKGSDHEFLAGRWEALDKQGLMETKELREIVDEIDGHLCENLED